MASDNIATNMATSRGCPLLELAPELRNRIYEEVLISNSKICLTDTEAESTWRSPGLLQTCSQIRHEAASIYYSSNTFVITCYGGSSDEPNPYSSRVISCKRGMLSWCKAIGEAMTQMLRKLYLDDVIYGGIESAASGLANYRTMLAAAGVPLTKCVLLVEFYDSSLGESVSRWLASDGSFEPPWSRDNADTLET